jgi:Tfp pilus assembly protein PilE
MNNSKKITITTLIALSTILILAVLVYISYQAHIKRQKVNEAFLLISPIQNEIVLYAHKHAGFKIEDELDNKALGLPQPFEIKGTYIKSVIAYKPADSNKIILTAQINPEIIPDLEDKNGYNLHQGYIKFTGQYQNAAIQWQCTSNLAKKYLPKSCEGV